MDLQEQLKKIKYASRKLAILNDDKINDILHNLADLLEKRSSEIIEINKKDLEKISSEDGVYDRILLDEKRVKSISNSVREIAEYTSPIDVVLEHKVLDNGLDLKKITTPLGVVGAVFEARPNVLIDTFVLCLKSKNACVMKGGSQCEQTNTILMKIVNEAIGESGNLSDIAVLLDNDRELLKKFLKMANYVDVIVPRGGQGLIDFVRENSLIPMIETGRGVCHVFVDVDADIQKAKDIVFNAKTQRPSVCNALDTLIIHEGNLENLNKICRPLEEKKVEIFADNKALESLDKDYSKDLLHRANEDNFGMEYLSLKMSIKTVNNVEEAIDHINKYGSMHSEAIITENIQTGKLFLRAVDAACVYVNASTRFTDGGVFGLGAEVGISTQKLHARGPMGIKELTSYKWEIVGDGQVRE